jgi:hypothetical protein
LHEAIANDVKAAHEANSKQGKKYFEEINPELEKIHLKEFPAIREKADAVLDKAKNSSDFGVTDPNISNDIIKRAQKAAQIHENYGAPTEGEKIYGKGKQPFPVNAAIEEERALSSTASDLRRRGDNAAARHYDDLAHGYKADIENTVKAHDVNTYDKLMKARDYWKNNVIPFRNGAPNKIINNNFDEEFTPHNISNTLTNGTNNQILSALPEAAKNRIAADMLFKKAYNGVGETSHPAIDLASTLNSLHPGRLEPLLGQNLKSQLSEILNSVEKNKKVLSDIRAKTKTVSGSGVGDVEPTKEGVLGLVKNSMNTPTAPYWSRFLSAKENPETLGAVMEGTPMDLNDIRRVQEGLHSPLRGQASDILSKPNKTRIPTATLLQAIQGRKKKDE